MNNRLQTLPLRCKIETIVYWQFLGRTLFEREYEKYVQTWVIEHLQPKVRRSPRLRWHILENIQNFILFPYDH